MSDKNLSPRGSAAQQQLRAKPLVKIVTGVFTLLIGAALGAVVWAVANAFGAGLPAWTVLVGSVVMLGWYLVSFTTRRDGGGISERLEGTVVSGAAKAVDPAKALGKLLDGIGRAPAMSTSILKKAGHVVTKVPLDGVDLEMVVTRHQQAALLVGVDLGGDAPADSFAVRRLDLLGDELAGMDWDMQIIAVSTNGTAKFPVTVGRVTVCSPTHVGKALARLPKVG